MPDTFTVRFTSCQLCQDYVSLESCATDEAGRAVHEECYVEHITRFHTTHFSLMAAA
jgi:hypothetical protein